MDPDELTLSDVHVCVDRETLTPYPSENSYLACKSRYTFTDPTDECSDTSDVDDDDGDLTIRRKPAKHVIYLAHTLETRLKDVGLQVWAGSLLMCDYLLSHPLHNHTVLELGAGVGLASIVAARHAQSITATDIGDSILQTCYDNMKQHDYMYSEASETYRVKQLDWTNDKLETGSSQFHWSEEDKTWLTKVDVMLAADVIYDLDLTDAFFSTVERLMDRKPAKTLFISLEKRLNFTYEELDVTCAAYDDFREHLRQLGSKSDCKSGHQEAPVYNVEQLETENMPQYFHGYTRSKYVELWKVTSCFDS